MTNTHLPFQAFIAWQGEANAEAEADRFEDYYIGEFPSRGEFAKYMLAEYVSPDVVADWDATADTLCQQDYHLEEKHGLFYAFHNI